MALNAHRERQRVLALILGLAGIAGSAAGATLPIANGDFELDAADNAAPPSGWTDETPTSFWSGVAGETGNPTPGEAATAPGGLGSYFLTTAHQSAGAGSQPVDGRLSQVVDLSPFGTAVDQGGQTVTIDFIYGSDDARDTGSVSLHFFGTTDATGDELGSGFRVNLDAGDGYTFTGWQHLSVGGIVPVGSRSMTLRIDTTRSGGSETNLWIDNFSGTIGSGSGADSDGDGLPDDYEQRIIDFDPADAVIDFSHVAGPGELPTTTDFDGDGSSDAEEHARGTDPTNADSDGDGLSDGVETGTHVDGGAPGTDPLKADSDFDGFGDGSELEAGSDPLDFASVPAAVTENPRSLPGLAEAASEGTFPVHREGVAATIVHDAADAKVVEIAAALLADDIEAVAGTRPRVTDSTVGLEGPVILAGTVGGSSLIDALVSSGKVDVSGILGNWECYHLALVADPLPGIDEALVVAGSDRRGTAYGLGSISEAMGVSPWTWWADVPPPQRASIHLAGLPLDSSPPSVRFRGIFINDEDWGLQEWAEKNYESGPGEAKDIGPKTYAKVFELLLRLRSNYCWPAMHPSTRAFHHYADNKQVADDHAIVMGSSHAEPMLRNNVDEWYRFTGDRGYSDNWNYAQNKDVIHEYWETRARETAPFENTFVIGKRGIHDSGMVEGSGNAEKAAWLNTIFADQRQILADHVNPDPSRVPQIFVPYKEVLSIYETGLVNVPDDVTLVWPDDNHGYIRRLSDDAEQQRAGGGGVYYHLSYWGAPQDYLWLSTIPPSLIWEEMTKAYQNQCHRLWVFNVGDIKPAEVSMEYALRLAWNVHGYGPDSQGRWLREWAAREFGPQSAGAIASIMNDYYRLNHRRKPEHMDWRDDEAGSKAPPDGSHYPLFSQVHEGDEVAERLGEFELLRQRADAVHDALPSGLRDAFYQLVVYPVRGSEAMNRKFLHTERAHRALAQGRRTVADHSAAAESAYDEIATETARYNQTVSGGKWNEMMDWRPRGLGVFDLPPLPGDPGPQSVGLGVAVEGRLVPAFTGEAGPAGAVVELHAVDDATLVAPMRETTLDGRRCVWTPGTGGNAAAGAGGRAEYSFSVPEAGPYSIKFEVRTPNVDDDSWWIELDGGTPQQWNNLGEGGPAGWRWRTWDTVSLAAGSHSLVVHEREDGAALAAIRIASGPASGALGEDDRFGEFRLPEFNSITRRSFFIDLINTEPGPLPWSAGTDDPWVRLSSTSGTLDKVQRLGVSIDWDLLPAVEHLSSAIHIRQGTGEVEVPVTVWNPAMAPAADFIEENGAIVIEAEHPSGSNPGADAAWVEVEDLGRGDGAMTVRPTTAPSLTTPAGILAGAPSLEYSFHLRTPGNPTIEASFLPALALNADRGRRYAVAIDGEAPTVVSLSSESGSGGTWSRSVLRSSIAGRSVHAIPSPGVHTLKIWMVDPGLVLDRVTIVTGVAPSTHEGLRETAAGAATTLHVAAGQTVVLDAGSTTFRRVVNHGTLEIRGASMTVEGDLFNFGTLRVTGDSTVEVGGNVANFGLVDSMSWKSDGAFPDYSEFGSSMGGSCFHLEDVWLDGGGIHLRVPGYEGHRYGMQRNETLDARDWIQAGAVQEGSGVPGSPVQLTFSWPVDGPRGFFRIELDGGE